MIRSERDALLVRIKSARSVAQTTQGEVARRVRRRGEDDHSYQLVRGLAQAVEGLADAAQTMLESLP